MAPFAVVQPRKSEIRNAYNHNYFTNPETRASPSLLFCQSRVYIKITRQYKNPCCPYYNNAEYPQSHFSMAVWLMVCTVASQL